MLNKAIAYHVQRVMDSPLAITEPVGAKNDPLALFRSLYLKILELYSSNNTKIEFIALL